MKHIMWHLLMLMIQNRSIICVMVLVLVQMTAKIDWNVGHFIDKINTQLQFTFVSLLIFCSSGPYASTFTSSLPLLGHGVKQDQDLKGPTPNLANDSQISGLNVSWFTSFSILAEIWNKYWWFPIEILKKLPFWFKIRDNTEMTEIWGMFWWFKIEIFKKFTFSPHWYSR